MCVEKIYNVIFKINFYYSVVYVFDRCLNRIVFDCNLVNNSLVFYGLKDIIG